MVADVGISNKFMYVLLTFKGNGVQGALFSDLGCLRLWGSVLRVQCLGVRGWGLRVIQSFGLEFGVHDV